MANLRLIKSLNQRYEKKSMFRDIDFDRINESFSSFDGKQDRRSFSERIGNIGPQFKQYFVDSESANVYLLFIDICSFSTRFAHLSNRDLIKLLDAYYDLVIPIIYKHNGEIDKIIGDGIIAVFGAPFTEEQDLANKINDCAKELILATKDTPLYSKVAVNSGDIIYYHNQSIHYEEFTIIGKPITELHRLESISIDKKINFYHNSDYDQFLQGRVSATPVQERSVAPWVIVGPVQITPPLKGVTRFNHRKTMEKR
jgi:hypothetical protein